MKISNVTHIYKRDQVFVLFLVVRTIFAFIQSKAATWTEYWKHTIALAIRVHHVTLHYVHYTWYSSRSHNRKESSWHHLDCLKHLKEFFALVESVYIVQYATNQHYNDDQLELEGNTKVLFLFIYIQNIYNYIYLYYI